MNYEREKITYSVGLKIRQLRLEKNLSQESLALGADVHPTYIGRLERGEKCPTIDTIYRIARALEVPVTALLDTPTVKRACDTSALSRIEMTAEEAAAAADIVERIAKETLIKTKSPRSNPHTHAADFVTLRFNQRIPKETLIKTKSPRSNPHTHAADFVTLRFNQRIPKETLIKSNSPRSNPHTHAADFVTLRFNQHVPKIRKQA